MENKPKYFPCVVIPRLFKFEVLESVCRWWKRSNHCGKQFYRIISIALKNSSKTPSQSSSVRMLQTNAIFSDFILDILWSHLEVETTVAVIISIGNNHMFVSAKKMQDWWSMLKEHWNSMKNCCLSETGTLLEIT